MKKLNITDIYSANIEYQADTERFAKETGFPSPARDHYEKRLSLDEHIVKRPAATFFVRVEGEGMNNSCIFSDDILVIDRSINPASGHLVMVLLDGSYTLKYLEKKNGSHYLCSEPNSRGIPVNEDLDYEIWGVVSHVIHKYI